MCCGSHDSGKPSPATSHSLSRESLYVPACYVASVTSNSVHGDSPGKNTIVGCHVLLQGIFPIQGSNPHLLCLLHWQEDSLPLASPGKPQRKPSVGLIWKSGLQRWRVWCEVGRLHSFRGSDPNPRLGPNLKMNWRTAKS